MRSVLPALATSTAVLVTFWVLVDTPATEIQRRKITGKDKAANLQVAIVLKQLGFHAGDPFGSIGDAFNAYWARLDRLRVVAEIPREDANLFWAAESVRQAQIPAHRRLCHHRHQLLHLRAAPAGHALSPTKRAAINRAQQLFPLSEWIRSLPEKNGIPTLNS